MANELRLRNVAFEVDDLQAAVDRLAADGYRLVGGIGQYEHIWRMAYVRGPEGIIVSLADEEVPVLPLRRPEAQFQADASYLITGGFGGFGLEIAKWMVDEGARNARAAEEATHAG